jgi:light-regulated signal transduction histidine kinase (bacteriophytochrome)
VITWIQGSLVVISFVVMLAAFVRALSLANAISAARQRTSWIVLLVLMGLFLCCYLGAIWIILSGRLHLLVSLSTVIFVLGAAFVFLTVRLSLAISQALLLDIDQRTRAQEEVRTLNLELEERVNERTHELESFTYSVSHDLRTPMGAISGYCTALLEDHGDVLDDEAKGYLNRISANNEHMGQLVNGLLHLAQLTGVELIRGEIDLSSMTSQIAEELQQRDPHRKVEFAIKPGLSITGDRALLQTVMENLLNNAWKFTSHHSSAKIEIDSEQIHGVKTFLVRDDGAGFDMVHVDKLFKTFKRLHDPQRFPGTGVGLATVRQIIHRHGGRIWATGTVEKGAAFYFSLPDLDPLAGGTHAP